VRTDWQPIIWALAFLSLVLGAVVALMQKDIKRMMAYSSINHAGFILLGVEAATTRGVSASLYYVFTYVFLVIGSFAVITVMSRRGDTGHQITDYRGLAKRQPLLALAFAVLLLGQAGAPFTTGFLAKFGVVGATVATHAYAVATVAMVSAAVAAFFYLRVAVTMYSPVGPVGDNAYDGGADAPRGGAETMAGEADAAVGDADAATGLMPRPRPRGRGVHPVSSLAVLTDAPPAESVVERGIVPVPTLTVVVIALSVGFTVVFGIIPGPDPGLRPSRHIPLHLTGSINMSGYTGLLSAEESPTTVDVADDKEHAMAKGPDRPPSDGSARSKREKRDRVRSCGSWWRWSLSSC
jgi:NADH:ubiquinone oxidoreductase subunit 5 (subunit L)/multisubunit Na+/H+ antiporter MnhA subunit